MIGIKPGSTAGIARVCCLLFFLALFGLGLGCSRDASGKPKQGDPRKGAVVPVTAAVAVEKAVPVTLEAIGNVQASATVLIRSRVEGELTGVHFREGDEVKTGDLLFTIDPQPFEAKLKQAEANLARNRAQLQAARKQAERYATVVKKGYVSADQHDQILANALALDASVRAGEAEVETARLQLKYCRIRSPINGITGQLRVHRGNLVKAGDNDNPLVAIKQTRPVYVVFSVPESNLGELKRHLAAHPPEVTVTIPGEERVPIKGKLTFLDNTVDQGTGTILLRGSFENAEGRLWPGQFVNVVVTLEVQEGAVVIPSQAVQTGQHGQYVFVLKEDAVVEHRHIRLSRSVGEEAVVESGLTAGETVITDGQLRLTNGSRVKIVQSSGTVGRANFP